MDREQTTEELFVDAEIEQKMKELFEDVEIKALRLALDSLKNRDVETDMNAIRICDVTDTMAGKA